MHVGPREAHALAVLLVYPEWSFVTMLHSTRLFIAFHCLADGHCPNLKLKFLWGIWLWLSLLHHGGVFGGRCVHGFVQNFHTGCQPSPVTFIATFSCYALGSTICYMAHICSSFIGSDCLTVLRTAPHPSLVAVDHLPAIREDLLLLNGT